MLKVMGKERSRKEIVRDEAVAVELGVVSDIELQKEVLVEWLATPEALRKATPSIKALMDQLGWSAGDVGRLMSDPDVAQMALKSVAAGATVILPRVLHLLLEACEAGSVTAMLGYMEWVRKTLQNDKLIEVANQHKVGPDIQVQINQVVERASDMRAFAESLGGTDATARKRIDEGRTKGPESLQARARMALESRRRKRTDGPHAAEDLPASGEGAGLETLDLDARFRAQSRYYSARRIKARAETMGVPIPKHAAATIAHFEAEYGQPPTQDSGAVSAVDPEEAPPPNPESP